MHLKHCGKFKSTFTDQGSVEQNTLIFVISYYCCYFRWQMTSRFPYLKPPILKLVSLIIIYSLGKLSSFNKIVVCCIRINMHNEFQLCRIWNLFLVSFLFFHDCSVDFVVLYLMRIKWIVVRQIVKTNFVVSNLDIHVITEPEIEHLFASPLAGFSFGFLEL